MLLDVASLEDEVEIMNTLYLLHLSREGFVFVLGVADIHLADALAVYPIKTDFDAATNTVRAKAGKYEVYYGSSSADKDLKKLDVSIEY